MLLWMVVMFGVMGPLIILHECGHYLVARLCRIRVEWFSIGLGPAIVARTSKTTGTTFRLGWIPFGGFVRIRGMDTAERVEPDDRQAYPNRPVWQRLATILAGPATSYLAVVALAMALYTCHGVDVPRWYGVGRVVPTYDAYGKLEAGDVIIAVDRVPLYLDSGPSLTDRVMASRGSPLVLTIERDGQRRDIPITPREDQDAAGRSHWRIGVEYDGRDLAVGLGVLDAAERALAYPVEQTRQIGKILYRIVFGSEQADPGGPIRMVEEFHHAYSAGIVPVIRLLMILGVYLGLVLAAPVPLFDGGRLVFLLYRAVTGQRPRLAR